jgi:activating signal cointegrator complex subunit 3
MPINTVKPLLLWLLRGGVQCLELRLWPEQHPLRQVEAALTPELLWKMEERGLSMERLDDMSAADIGAFLRHPAVGEAAENWTDACPMLAVEKLWQVLVAMPHSLQCSQQQVCSYA